MLLSDYATKTEIMNRAMATVPDLWPIGIDYGFSSVKGISPNKIFVTQTALFRPLLFLHYLIAQNTISCLKMQRDCGSLERKPMISFLQKML